ncbi:unnamed protein product [Lasius platythorax]|uniref:Uncharacterized protein n=1 Tax=Lasius platythorax TaxID=488582 RepID=A0AAV2NIB7_9HYME
MLILVLVGDFKVIVRRIIGLRKNVRMCGRVFESSKRARNPQNVRLEQHCIRVIVMRRLCNLKNILH